MGLTIEEEGLAVTDIVAPIIEQEGLLVSDFVVPPPDASIMEATELVPNP